MLNYANLNDTEFEALCKDIMEQMLGVSLRRFAPGRDGGVDLTDDVAKKTVVVQVKHYQQSSTAALVNSLKKELSKVKMLKPQKYYICCSRSLSQENIKALYCYFSDYMDSDRHIVTLLEIDDFLKMPENRDILKKHFKLWLDDTGIMSELRNDELFVDCEAFLDGVEDLQKLFVRTRAFDRALKVLDSKHTLCIVGDPGVGKTITSKMLVLYYAANGYRVRYTSNVTDFASIKRSLSLESRVKEVILLDDCFGQAYFEMRSSQSSQLIDLIRYVRRHSEKKLILNSRVTILQEARSRQRELIRCMDQEDFKVFVLDMTNLSKEEKAKILYNHLSFSEIPEDYFRNIRTAQRYRLIVDHVNYNPRIIEFVCSPGQYKTVSSDQFFEFVWRNLNNPSEMWADEYDDRLQQVDRILLQSIYSLTNQCVGEETVRRVFEHRIADIPGIDKTVNQFDRSLQRLSEGFVKILDQSGMRMLSMRNPSVNDFLDGRFRHDSLERKDLVRSFTHIRQMRILSESEKLPFAVDLLKTGQIYRIYFENSRERTAFIALTILNAGLKMEQYRPQLLEFVTHFSESRYWYYPPFPTDQDPFLLLMAPDIWNYYDLASFFMEEYRLYRLLCRHDLEDGVRLITACNDHFNGNDRRNFIDQVESFLEEMVSECCSVDANQYNTNADVGQAIRCATEETPDGPEIDEAYAAEILEDEIRAEVLDELQSYCYKLPRECRHCVWDLTIEDISVDNADDLVEAYLEDVPDYDDMDYDDDKEDEEYLAVDAIFER